MASIDELKLVVLENLYDRIKGGDPEDVTPALLNSAISFLRNFKPKTSGEADKAEEIIANIASYKDRMKFKVVK